MQNDRIYARFPARFAGFALTTALVAGGFWLLASVGPSTAQNAKLLPAPQVDVSASAGLQTAVFAGGCFWGIQAVFQHVEGVRSATSGYAGGSAETANYRQTETGLTSHAEAVQVVFDPAKVSYGDLLQIFFSAAHDPTAVNRQGPDVGPQYRSAVFPQTNEQANVAARYIDQLNGAKTFASPLATTVEQNKPFYVAETYHQNYLINNLTQPYIAIYELPKIESLKKLFPGFYREAPTLEVETN